MPKLNRSWLVGAGLGWLVAAGGLLAQEGAAPLALPKGPTLGFVSETNRDEAKAEDMSAPFTIYVTNVCTTSIVIQEVQASCHCTVATMPADPWILAPGES